MHAGRTEAVSAAKTMAAAHAVAAAERVSAAHAMTASAEAMPAAHVPAAHVTAAAAVSTAAVAGIGRADEATECDDEGGSKPTRSHTHNVPLVASRASNRSRPRLAKFFPTDKCNAVQALPLFVLRRQTRRSSAGCNSERKSSRGRPRRRCRSASSISEIFEIAACGLLFTRAAANAMKSYAHVTHRRTSTARRRSCAAKSGRLTQTLGSTGRARLRLATLGKRREKRR